MGALRDLLPCVLDESPLCKNFCSERFQVCEGILLPDCQRSQHLGTKSPSSPNGCHQQAAHTGSEVSTNRPAATRAILESHNSSLLQYPVSLVTSSLEVCLRSALKTLRVVPIPLVCPRCPGALFVRSRQHG